MLDSNFFENEAKNRDNRKENFFSKITSLVVRNVEDAINRLSKSSIFSVRVAEDKERDRLLMKISESLQSLQYFIKSSSQSSSLGKISVKTPDLVTLNKSIEDILRRIEKKNMIVNVPSSTYVRGEVAVKNFPQQYNFERLYVALQDVRESISRLKLDVNIPQAKIPDIKIPSFPEKLTINGIDKLSEGIKVLQDYIKELPKKMPEMVFPESVKVSNFPPTKYPMPVTNININPLRGFLHSTAVTVTTSLTPLPGEVLVNRRSIIVFNNDASNTVYIGGSEMSSSDGLPVLAQTYSPVIDAGPRMIVYGMTASSTANVRVLEASNENIGG